MIHPQFPVAEELLLAHLHLSAEAVNRDGQQAA